MGMLPGNQHFLSCWNNDQQPQRQEQPEFVFCACPFPTSFRPECLLSRLSLEEPFLRYCKCVPQKRWKLCHGVTLKALPEITAFHHPRAKACHQDDPTQKKKWTRYAAQVLFSNMNFRLSREWNQVKANYLYSLFEYCNLNHRISCNHFGRWLVLKIWADLEEFVDGFKCANQAVRA